MTQEKQCHFILDEDILFPKRMLLINYYFIAFFWALVGLPLSNRTTNPKSYRTVVEVPWGLGKESRVPV
ncbi:hypothetical protein CPB86DRAFT_130220 [Serendipita vermifera]|nr:hypothetical protein CPB86DRAFT_130220 [Serendipita vermifera]